ncbi:TatD family hydrolase [Rhodospirillum rubrum]|uniref:TatD-related deoxyribonuclease n=1 Tax=Rhodospirillum rubrum (strain ATCC 11170 / ATH 1.1.1 / DSM 467 / LMG 4362 / NCIMB 8255 / S1) TaxID=269796 RepID=Q2RTP5_RHORT|nr:TatD family hydrolase [Rhodospirillum rubrum]ABC22500.1 TatD-related deoxyribonuclease [Rhodospirillum rubrum ATCC 11170]AEO48218.1 TatD-related deoxyribonuclease [Rhodospirillum rubrum F11]MBK5954088.1 TatD-related deoxyribonuclease [Rhodospirillum rubrum]QXG82130.1 TatD family hydrolase [Rhodospirillum rubrum]HAQ00995.1 TatD family deoxyribonuclease [Rhodospirillum rubrum]
MIVDSHCHLDFPDFAPDIDAVVERARTAGVGTMLTICTHVSRFPGVLAMAERFPDVWCTVGIHPHEAANEAEVDAETLVRLTENPRVVGLGETGLDYFYDNSPREAQRRSFRAHLAAGRLSGLPVVIHTRDADADTAAILREEREKGPFKALLHCFSSGKDLADLAVEMGLYVSMSGILTFPKAEDVRTAIADVPLDRLLVETDAPFLAPTPKRGKRNEPALVVHTAAKLAEVKGVAVEALWAATTDNFFTLFDKCARPTGSAPQTDGTV